MLWSDAKLRSSPLGELLEPPLAIRFDSHAPLKSLLLIAAAVHLAEFVVNNILFKNFATPYFTAPLQGTDNFTNAYAITRQYGFFMLNLAALDLVAASNPVLYQPFIRAMAGLRLVQVGFAVYELSAGNISLEQFFPVVVWDSLMAVALWTLCPPAAPKERFDLMRERELAAAGEIRFPFGLRFSAKVKYQTLRWLVGTLGVSQVAWFLLSTVFWQLGAAIIQANSMETNLIMSRQQGILLLAFGVTDLIAARHPVYYRRMIQLLMLQQFLGGVGAAVELYYGSIQLPQFCIVAAGQIAIIWLFNTLYPRINPPDEVRRDG